MDTFQKAYNMKKSNNILLLGYLCVCINTIQYNLIQHTRKIYYQYMQSRCPHPLIKSCVSVSAEIRGNPGDSKRIYIIIIRVVAAGVVIGNIYICVCVCVCIPRMPTEDLLKRVRPLWVVVVGSKTIRIPAGGQANYNNNGRIAAVVGANPSAGPFLLSSFPYSTRASVH